MLALQSLRQRRFAESGGNQIVVGRTFAGENLAAGINERQDDRRIGSFVLGLHMIDNAIMLHVCVVTSDHVFGSELRNRLKRSSSTARVGGSNLNGSTAFFCGSIFFCPKAS